MKTSERVVQLTEAMVLVFHEFPEATPEPMALARLLRLKDQIPGGCRDFELCGEVVYGFARRLYGVQRPVKSNEERDTIRGVALRLLTGVCRDAETRYKYGGLRNVRTKKPAMQRA